MNTVVLKGETPNLSTYGLKEGGEWADRLGVSDHFLLTLDVCGIYRRPNALGTILHALAQSQQLLEDWSDEEEGAVPLAGLAKVLRNEPAILARFEPYRDLEPARKKFIGDLEYLYLPTVFADETRQASNADREWWRRFALWLLTHAMNRAMHGALSDSHVRNVCRVAYSASNKQRSPWRHPMIHSLATTRVRFLSLNRHLLMEAGTFAGDLRFGERSKADLDELMAVARFEAGRDKDQIAFTPAFSSGWRAKSIVQVISQPWEDGDSDNPDDEVQSGILSAAPVIRPGEVVETTSGIGRSESENDRVGESILLLTAEERQFLPWAWSTPNKSEQDAIEDWLRKSLASGDATLCLLGAIAWMSMLTGRRIQDVLSYRLSIAVGQDWSVNVRNSVLARTPAIRDSSWEPTEDVQRQWVRDLAEAQVLPMPPDVAAIIGETSQRHPAAQSIQDLWLSVSSERLELSLGQALRSVGSRLHVSMLPKMKAQTWFEQKGDDAFARLMASGPKTGLPAACAYASWTNGELSTGSAPAVNPDAAAPIVMGSRLDPIEELLVDAIRTAQAEVESLREGDDVIRFHNVYTTYRLMELYAASGGRPIADSFESPGHFDRKLCAVFIDDKASAGLRQGRFVPLPKRLVEDIFGDYLIHLSMLATAVDAANSGLAAEIQLLAAGRPSARLPFFFKLVDDGGLDWESMTPKGIEDLALFNWPLPANLFRHRLAQAFRRRGLNSEIIAGILGHAEAQSASYGDHSFRTWLDDAEEARPVVEESFRVLRFPRMSTWTKTPSSLSPQRVQKTLGDKPYGSAAREAARRRSRWGALRSAKAQIDRVLNGRVLGDLTEEEIYRLAQDLLFNEKGMPSAHGYLKYGFLIHQIERIRKKTGRTTKLRKRFFMFQEERSVFGPDAVGATERLLEMRAAAPDEQIVATHLVRGRPAGALAAAVLLCLRNRVADLAVLRDVARMERIRLVAIDGLPHLEHGTFVSITDPDAAVRRIPLTGPVAALLSNLHGGVIDTDLRVKRNLPRVWAPLLAVLERGGKQVPASRDELLSTLASLVDQANVLSLPGVLAGRLAGRVKSFAPTWADVIFLRTGRRVVIPNGETRTEPKGRGQTLLLSHVSEQDRLPTPDSGNANDEDDSDLNGEGATSELDLEDTRLSARRAAAMQFYSEIRCCLKGNDPERERKVKRRVIRNGKPLKGRPATRRDITGWLARTLVRHKGAVSSAVLLLGEWILSRLKTELEFSSIIRYANALSVVFEEVAYDADLLAMDEDDIVEFYTRVVTARQRRAARFPYARLMNFHRWAQQSDYGLPQIDWGELPDMPDTEGALPGLLGEKEYLEAMALIQTLEGSRPDLAIGVCFMLLCAYRFGLRRRESWGMSRRDWIAGDDQTIVLVRANRWRKLKTRGSRRQVPLFFSLHQAERDLIARCLGRFEATHGDKDELPLLAGSGGELVAVEQYSTLINAALKSVTGNTSLSLHHARHSFANHLMLAAIGALHSWNGFALIPAGGTPDVLRVLLGRVDCRRRIAWAIARALGHMGATTTFRNYTHVLDDWAATMVGIEQMQVKGELLPGFIDLDAFAIFHPVVMPLALPAGGRCTGLTFEASIGVLRLLARGRSVSDVAFTLNLAESDVTRVSEAVRAIGSRLTLQATGKDDRKSAWTTDFLKRITHDGWKRLGSIVPKAMTLDVAQPAAKVLEAMVGRRRQLLMWDDDSFGLGRWLVDTLCISPDCIHVVASRMGCNVLIGRGSEHGFEVVSFDDHMVMLEGEAKRRYTEACDRAARTPGAVVPEGPRKPAFQIDRVFVGDSAAVPTRRCAIVFREGADGLIRNSLEWLAASIAAAVSLPGK